MGSCELLGENCQNAGGKLHAKPILIWDWFQHDSNKKFQTFQKTTPYILIYNAAFVVAN